jgi:hypothetical protein
MQNYWHRKNRITLNVFNKVDWDTIGRAMKVSTPSKRRWVIKHSTGFCGVNYELHKRNEKSSPNYTRCGLVETTSHVWKCQQPEAQEIWSNSIQALKQWLESTCTPPTTLHAICSHLQNWRDDKDVIKSPEATVAIQNHIGWGAGFEGCLGKEWRIAQ